jgi:hypothetical protein
VTAVSSINAGGRILASAIQGIAPLAVIKGADQSVTSNNSSYVADNALLVPVVANATYLFWCYLFYTGFTNGASDLQWAWVPPSGATLNYQRVGNNSANSVVVDQTYQNNANVTAATNGTSDNMALSLTGSLIMSSTPGNLFLEWCQVTSSSTATTVKAGSFVALWRVS